MIAKLWWMVHKDLASEWRARRVWPAMLLFGAVVALVFSVQMDLLPDQRAKIAGGLLWLAIFFAGMPAIDRSLASERDEGCWDALRLYPMPSTLIYLAKLLTNIMALAALECFIVPLFIVLCGVSLDAHPWHVVFIAALGNFGISAVGTLVSAPGGRHAAGRRPAGPGRPAPLGPGRARGGRSHPTSLRGRSRPRMVALDPTPGNVRRGLHHGGRDVVRFCHRGLKPCKAALTKRE